MKPVAPEAVLFQFQLKTNADVLIAFRNDKWSSNSTKNTYRHDAHCTWWRQNFKLVVINEFYSEIVLWTWFPQSTNTALQCNYDVLCYDPFFYDKKRKEEKFNYDSGGEKMAKKLWMTAWLDSINLSGVRERERNKTLFIAIDIWRAICVQ